MGYAYWQSGLHEQEAVFHLFFRRPSVYADYVLTSGLQNIIDFLENFHFSETDIEFLSKQYGHVFSVDFLAYLKSLRFTGNVEAMPEGTIAFSNEPILRVRAPLILCQLLETPLINFMNFSSAVSTLASRMRLVADNALLYEFGLRRAQGPDGGLTASRASYIGGFDATSNILAGETFHIPLVGTMSHGWVMSYKNELIAFQEYAKLMPSNVVLLVDTYHTLKGIDNAITVGCSLKQSGGKLKAVRLDSGDLFVLSIEARKRLDAAGLTDTKVFVSGDLSLDKIEKLKAQHVPIDGYGVGTYLVTSYQQPALDMVYKLGAIKSNNAWQFKLKLSDNETKTSDPGLLQVQRYYQESRWLKDVIYLDEENKASDDALLKPLFRDGKFVGKKEALADIRQRAMKNVIDYTASKSNAAYPVVRDAALKTLRDQLIAEAKNAKK